MTPEEYQRIKEAEKEHLRSLRKLKEAVRSLDRQHKVSAAMRDMAEGGVNALDASSDAVDQLALETAHNEARLEVALESAASENNEADAQKLAEADEVLRRERAKELVRQLRGEGTSTSSTPESLETHKSAAKEGSTGGARESSSAAEPKPGTAKPSSSPLPEKTIGRMKP